jgi:hypothetical protein
MRSDILTVIGLAASFVVVVPHAGAQVFLNADGQSDTYTLINQTLGGTAEETPDCSHPDFGPHITQEFDSDLSDFAFTFYIHVTPDNDRCINFDRQRNEIKTYEPSPNYLKGFYGDRVAFSWNFKLDQNFQPSPNFTHIHQIKAADGDAASPILTLTPRFGNPNILQLIHVNSSGQTTILGTAGLAAMAGQWVHAYETIIYGANGSYSITLTALSDGTPLFTYSSDNLDLWRSGTTFVRPKWGIYRSLNHPEYLRDEAVRFQSFCLAKGTDDCN